MIRVSMPNRQLASGQASTTLIPAPHSIPERIPNLQLDTESIPYWMLMIPGATFLINRLGPSECRRRLLHMLPGLLPCLLWIIPHRDPWGPPLMNATILITVGIVGFALFRAHAFSRPDENQWSYAVAGYAVPVLGMLILLPGRSELGLMTLGIMGLGDGSAALGGLAIGGKRLPWNRKKTWTGLACFIVVATIMSALYYWIEARPGVPLKVAFAIAAVSALMGAVVESLPIRSHDNLRVGATAAISALCMHVMLLGW